MKKNISIIFLIFLLACSKSGNEQNPANPPTAYVKYKANGEQVEFTGTYETWFAGGSGVYGVKLIELSLTRYIILGTSDPNNSINFGITTDSLKEKMYVLHNRLNGAALAIKGRQYWKHEENQLPTFINITRHNGGTLDADFHGVFYAPVDNTDLSKGYDSIIVSEGQIKNLQMAYQK